MRVNNDQLQVMSVLSKALGIEASELLAKYLENNTDYIVGDGSLYRSTCRLSYLIETKDDTLTIEDYGCWDNEEVQLIDIMERAVVLDSVEFIVQAFRLSISTIVSWGAHSYYADIAPKLERMLSTKHDDIPANLRDLLNLPYYHHAVLQNDFYKTTSGKETISMYKQTKGGEGILADMYTTIVRYVLRDIKVEDIVGVCEKFNESSESSYKLTSLESGVVQLHWVDDWVDEDEDIKVKLLVTVDINK